MRNLINDIPSDFQTEQVDDVPLLIHEMEKSDLSTFLNKFFPDHGNWKGLSGGKVTVGFLSYILSQSDHRLNQVEDWSSSLLYTLSSCFGEEVRSKDFTDDHLGSLLDRYSDREQWSAFENAFNKNLLQVYNLEPSALNSEDENGIIRLDATVVQSHRSESGIFQKGYSKQHRSDLPQLKVMVATIDPFSMPLTSLIVPGNKADDVLYVPVINELHQGLEHLGQLFVGDSKLGSFTNRSHIQELGHYYLSPLSKIQCSKEQINIYLQSPNYQNATSIYSASLPEKQPTTPKLKAKVFEQKESLFDEITQTQWIERRLVVFSPSFAKKLTNNLEQRLKKGILELENLLLPKQGKKKLTSIEEIQLKVDKVLQQHKIKDLITVQINTHINLMPLRKYKDRPTGMKEVVSFSLSIESNEENIDLLKKTLGWRVYATNAPQRLLSAKQAVLCYRNEYRIEHKFKELMHQVTKLMPVFLNKENRIKALIRLLLLALKFASLIQFKVRQQLQQKEQVLKAIVPGNPSKKVDKPTIKMLLEAFCNISLIILPFGDNVITKINKLTNTQAQILELLQLDKQIFSNIEQFFFSKQNFSES